MQIRDKGLLDEWFPQALRSHSRRAAGPTLLFDTESGFEVAFRGDVVAVGRREGAHALFTEVTSLMTGKSGATWAGDQRFAALAASLPAGLLGTIAIQVKHEALMEPPWLRLWPGVDLAVVGMREGDGRLDVLLRAVSSSARKTLQLGDKTVSTIERLPEGTLLAWATMVDWPAEYEALLRGGGGPHPILSVLDEWFVPEQFRARVLEKLGPRTVIVWGQDTVAGSPVPQIALMVELRDPRGGERTLESFIMQALGGGTITAKNGRKTSSVTTRTTTYLGVRIVRMSLRRTAAADDPQSGRLAREVKPSFAMLDGWLVVALNRSHIRRIIEARRVSPSLGRLPDLRGQAGMLERSRTIGVMQPSLAAAVMTRWMQNTDADQASFLDSSWWDTSPQPVSSPKIGIAVKVNNDPGMVEVVRVHPGAAAEGRMEAGDQIVGVDGRLLSLLNPNVDLRTRLARSGATVGPTLRVLRNGALVDVALSIETGVEWVPRIDPVTALRELVTLASQFSFASFSAAQVDEHHYSAHLALRLRRPATQ